MGPERYVVIGLAPARAAWFTEVARWATSGSVPVEFVKVVSVEEARARLRSGRLFSALVVDARSPGLDRDLIDLAASRGSAVIVVDEPGAAERWAALGVPWTLPPAFDREALLEGLRDVAVPLARGEAVAAPVPFSLASPPGEPPEPPGAATAGRGRLVAVTGAGGVGRSTLAMALATGLAADPRDRGLVVLADLALHAQQALLHDAGDIVPGVLELVEGHRAGRLDADAIHRLCFTMTRGGYDLLLGLRRQRDWVALRSRALDAALEGLRRTYRVVVADVDADVEGEAECGSTDVEDRNVLARTTLRTADLILVVGRPDLAGIHGLLRVAADLVAFGVDPGRLVPVVNRSPRAPRARAEITATLGRMLAATLTGVQPACTPLFVPERRRLDDALRHGDQLPPALVMPVAGAVRSLLERVSPALPAGGPASRHGARAEWPQPVVPGSLGAWSDDAEAS